MLHFFFHMSISFISNTKIIIESIKKSQKKNGQSKWKNCQEWALLIKIHAILWKTSAHPHYVDISPTWTIPYFYNKIFILYSKSWFFLEIYRRGFSKSQPCSELPIFRNQIFDNKVKTEVKYFFSMN